MITILGKGEATLTFIADNMAHRSLEFEQLMVLINNFDIPDQTEYKHPAFKWQEYEYLEEARLLVRNLKNYVLGVFSPNEKVKALALFKQDRETFINAIHANTAISRSAQLGRGLLVNPAVTVGSFSHLGDFVSLDRNVAVAHHVTIEDFASVHQSATIGANCIIGECASIGMGAIIMEGVSIGSNAIIGAGAIVYKDIPSSGRQFAISRNDRLVAASAI